MKFRLVSHVIFSLIITISTQWKFVSTYKPTSFRWRGEVERIESIDLEPRLKLDHNVDLDLPHQMQSGSTAKSRNVSGSRPTYGSDTSNGTQFLDLQRHFRSRSTSRSKFRSISARACPEGFYGKLCSHPCPKKCGRRCHVDGRCLHCAQTGLALPRCQDKCRTGFYGIECRNACPDACYNSICHHTTGHCLRCKEPGLVLPWCRDTCPRFTFGLHCKQRCEACSIGCQASTGQCLTSCSQLRHLGGTSTNCTLPTRRLNARAMPRRAASRPESTKGAVCPAKCRGPCDEKSGHCQSCLPGFEPPRCTKSCRPGYYGSGCNLACPASCGPNGCSGTSGRCRGCPSGFQGFFCKNRCVNGTYGPGCSLGCPETCLDRKCHQVTGECLACEAGYVGETCQNFCVNGSFGVACAFRCSRHCRGHQCDPVSGECAFCFPGYMGDFCNESCPETYFGVHCSQPCSERCLDRKCKNVDGRCLECPEGIRGLYCTENATLSEATAPEMRRRPHRSMVVLMVFGILIAVVVSSVNVYVYGKLRPKAQATESLTDVTQGQMPSSVFSDDSSDSRASQGTTRYELKETGDGLHHDQASPPRAPNAAPPVVGLPAARKLPHPQPPPPPPPPPPPQPQEAPFLLRSARNVTLCLDLRLLPTRMMGRSSAGLSRPSDDGSASEPQGDSPPVASSPSESTTRDVTLSSLNHIPGESLSVSSDIDKDHPFSAGRADMRSPERPFSARVIEMASPDRPFKVGRSERRSLGHPFSPRVIEIMPSPDPPISACGIEMLSPDRPISAIETEIRSSDRQFSAIETEICSADRQLSAKETEIRSSDRQLSAMETEIRSSDRQLSAIETEIRSSDRQLSAKETDLLSRTPSPVGMDDMKTEKKSATRITSSDEQTHHDALGESRATTQAPRAVADNYQYFANTTGMRSRQATPTPRERMSHERVPQRKKAVPPRLRELSLFEQLMNAECARKLYAGIHLSVPRLHKTRMCVDTGIILEDSNCESASVSEAKERGQKDEGEEVEEEEEEHNRARSFMAGPLHIPGPGYLERQMLFAPQEEPAPDNDMEGLINAIAVEKRLAAEKLTSTADEETGNSACGKKPSSLARQLPLPLPLPLIPPRASRYAYERPMAWQPTTVTSTSQVTSPIKPADQSVRQGSGSESEPERESASRDRGAPPPPPPPPPSSFLPLRFDYSSWHSFKSPPPPPPPSETEKPVSSAVSPAVSSAVSPAVSPAVSSQVLSLSQRLSASTQNILSETQAPSYLADLSPLLPQRSAAARFAAAASPLPARRPPSPPQSLRPPLPALPPRMRDFHAAELSPDLDLSLRVPSSYSGCDVDDFNFNPKTRDVSTPLESVGPDDSHATLPHPRPSPSTPGVLTPASVSPDGSLPVSQLLPGCHDNAHLVRCPTTRFLSPYDKFGAASVGSRTALQDVTKPNDF